MNKSSWIPIFVSLLFIGLGAIMAYTNLFHPIIVFIHSKNITPFQGVACIFGALIGFFIVFQMLIRLGASLLPGD